MEVLGWGGAGQPAALPPAYPHSGSGPLTDGSLRGTDTERSLACWCRCHCHTRPQPHTHPHLRGTGVSQGQTEGGLRPLLPFPHSCPWPAAQEKCRALTPLPSSTPCPGGQATGCHGPWPRLIPKSSGLPFVHPHRIRGIFPPPLFPDSPGLPLLFSERIKGNPLEPPENSYPLPFSLAPMRARDTFSLSVAPLPAAPIVP